MTKKPKKKAKRSKKAAAKQTQIVPTYLRTGSIQIGLSDVIKALQMIEKYGHLGQLANNARKHQLGMSVPMATVNFLKDFIVKHDMCDDPIGRHIVGGNGRPVLSTASGPSKSAGDPNQCNFGRAG